MTLKDLYKVEICNILKKQSIELEILSGNSDLLF